MGRVYTSADWHGCGKVAKKVLEYLQPDDTLYFIGDAMDRGKDGMMILDALMNRPNTHYIKGNHDEMLERAIPYMIRDLEEIKSIEPERYPDNTWFCNGGWKTIEGGLIDDPPEEAIKRLQKYKKFFMSLSTELKYRSPKGHMVILEHAGYTPFDIPHRSHDPLWDRDHFYDNWVAGIGAAEMVRDTYLVHGHTPVQYLKFEYGYRGEVPLTKEEIKHKYDWYENKTNYIPEVIRYCDGHKFDIDMCTICSGRIALLDLDTFEIKYFDEDEGE